MNKNIATVEVKKRRKLYFREIVFITLFISGAINNLYAQSPLCTSYPTIFCCEYVSEVSINGVTRAGAPDATGFSSGPGYFDYTGSSIGSFVAGNTYPVSVTVKTNSTYQEFVKIWFDFNGNGNLSDSGELVFDKVNTFNGTYVYSDNITVPSTAFNGDVYIRVVMVYANSPALCGTYSYGTTLDFKASISGGVSSQNLTVSTLGSDGYNGNITSSPSGINTSDGINSANFADGSTVSLTATPTGAAKFTGWSGDASGTDNPLSVTMSSAKNITANFGSPNNPPTATADTYNWHYTESGVGFSVAAPGVLGNDSDGGDGPGKSVGNPRTISLTNGTVVLASDGSFTYTPSSTLSSQTGANGFIRSETFTYYVTDGIDNSGSATVTLNFYVPYFTGATNNDFNVASNWFCGVIPSSNMNLIIGANKTLNVNTNYTCKNLQFETGSSFNCSNGSTLTITGDVLKSTGATAIDVNSSLQVKSSLQIQNP